MSNSINKNEAESSMYSPESVATKSSMFTLNNNNNKSISRRNTHNLVLSTSFISSRNNCSPSPTSPLQSRRPRSSVSKVLNNLQTEISQLNQELAQAKKKKDNLIRLRNATTSEIFSGAYSTEHLQKHSMRIKANTQLREMDKKIKLIEKEIMDMRLQYDTLRKDNDIERTLTKTSSKGISREDVSSIDSNNDGGSLDRASSTDIANSPKTIADIIDVDGIDLSNPDLTHEKSVNSLQVESATWLISDYMQSLQEANLSPDFILKKGNSLVEILKEHKELRQDLVLTSFMFTLQSLLLNEDKLVVSMAYRICRYLIDGEKFIAQLITLRLDAFIIISLSKDNNSQVEREQALKLVRAMAEYEKGITKGIMQAIISCVEKADDSLRIMALETLLELCFLQPQFVSCCKGMRVLENLLHDYSSFPLASIILDTILGLMSTHETRKYFLKDINITVLATVFSDTNTKSSMNVEKLQNATILISRALKNINGFILFSTDNFKPIKELLSFFQVPLCAFYLIDMFLDVLRIKPLSFKSKGNQAKFTPSEFQKDAISISQYLALIIQVLDHCNFQDYVSNLLNVNLNQPVNHTLIEKARYLISEYFNLRMNLVDNGNLPEFQRIPKDNTAMVDETFRVGKITSKLNKNRNTFGMSDVNYIDEIIDYSQKIKESTIAYEVDDMRFRRMVYDTRVLQTKDFSTWNWNIIQELLEGPLLNKRQLEELSKSTKFIRRLLVFYRPMRLRFSNVDKGARLSQKYIQVGCLFFKMLTSHSEGMKILMDDTKIIPQLASLLFRAMEGNMSGNMFSESSLKTKIIDGYFRFVGVLTQSTSGVEILTRWNFFTVIYKMFQIDSPLALKFLMLTLPELDLTHSAHCRTIIGKALVISNEHVRLLATKNVGLKLKELLSTKRVVKGKQADKLKLQSFKIELLTRQLYDLSPKVVAVADKALYECIMKNENSKDLSFSFRTFLNQMVFIRSPILFELLSKPYGFQLLNAINFVEQERRSWLDYKNREYVSIIEDFLVMSLTNVERSHLGAGEREKLPLHFYGSLARTEDGITLLSQSGDLVKFMNLIKKYVNDSMVNENPNDIIDIKAALWCCGFIGSTELGIGLLDNYSLVEDIIKISYNATVTSVKFTTFFVLGLIGRTREGCEILDEMGWYCAISVQGKPMGIALPKRLNKFLSFSEMEWQVQGEYEEEIIEFYTDTSKLVTKADPVELDLDHLLRETNILENPLSDKDINIRIDTKDIRINGNKKRAKSLDSSNRNGLSMSATRKDRANTTVSNSGVLRSEDESLVEEVMKTVSQLGNHILSNGAIKGITDLNNKYGSALFESEVMFTRVMSMMDKFRFKPHVRKFLCGLFINKNALENVIKSERRRVKQ